MQMRPAIQITTMLKALTDVVMPAIDPANKPAMEQAHLIKGMLALMASQLPVQFRFDCDELARLVQCARTLHAAVGANAALDATAASLQDQCAQAESILERACDPADLLASVRSLKSTIGALIGTAATSADTATQLRIEEIVLAMSREQLLRDRALMNLQGFEPDPAAIPPIAELLAQGNSNASGAAARSASPAFA